MLTNKITDHFLRNLDQLEYGHFRLVMPDGKTRIFQGKQPGAAGTLELRDWSVLKNMATKGDVGFAEDYKSGLWETDNLENLLTLGLQNEQVMSRFLFGHTAIKIKERLNYFLRRNTVKGSEKNIHAHYDLGNAFYKLWLDPTMSYSSALFHTQQESLQQAQHNKYDRILDVLRGNEGKLLEIGCGWGGFLDRATLNGNFDLQGITISQEQHDYAKQRVGTNAQVNYTDYRHQKGTFDSIVSIEMFEAVGEKYWPTYFDKVKSLLNPQGKAVIQTITIHDNLFDKYRKGSDAIRSFIFPGGMLPSPSVFKQAAARSGLRADNQFDFGLDYAATLKQWLKTFDVHKDDVKALGFDDSFIRLWRFYLASCIAGFKTGRTNVMQIELTHA